MNVFVTLRKTLYMSAISLCLASQATAIVLHPSDDPPTGLSTPADSVVGRWANGASAVAIASDFIITTRHQGGGIGTTVTFGGNAYTVAEIFNHPTADLRVVRIETPGGAPAGLTDFVGIYSQTDEVGQVAVLGGFGEGRGADVSNGLVNVGYEWAGFASRQLRWGANLINGSGLATIDPLTSGGGFTSDVLRATFEDELSGVNAEASLAFGDSGGGWFLLDGGQWKVAGLSRAVQNTNEAIYSPPELLDSVRLSSYVGFINSIVPEPTTAGMLLSLLSLGVVARGRREA